MKFSDKMTSILYSSRILYSRIKILFSILYYLMKSASNTYMGRLFSILFLYFLGSEWLSAEGESSSTENSIVEIDPALESELLELINSSFHENESTAFDSGPSQELQEPEEGTHQESGNPSEKNID